MFTLANWFLLIFWASLTIVIGVGIAYVNGFKAEGWFHACIYFIVTAIVLFVIIIGVGLYNTYTASVKDSQSELSDGIDKEITITAEDGKQYIIYYGIQDTITIIEK